jgi:hypothetical protein
VESASKFPHILIVNTIDCSRHCSGHFQVSKANEISDEGGEANNEEGNQGYDEECNEERDEEEDEQVNEEIISPTSYVSRIFGEAIK